MRAYIQLIGIPNGDVAFAEIKAALNAVLPDLAVSRAEGCDIAKFRSIFCSLAHLPDGYVPMEGPGGTMVEKEEILKVVSKTRAHAIGSAVFEAIPRQLCGKPIDKIVVTDDIGRAEFPISVAYGKAVKRNLAA